MTTVSLPMLSRVQIASPCPVKWEDMHAVGRGGDGDRARHCDECDLNVYNLSAMTADEAEALLVAHEGRRICGAFYRREDGTVLTRDCPVGLALVRAKLARAVARLSAVVGLSLAAVVALGARSREQPRLRNMDPFATIVAWLNPAGPLVTPAFAGKMAMPMAGGRMACPPPPYNQPPKTANPPQNKAQVVVAIPTNGGNP